MAGKRAAFGLICIVFAALFVGTLLTTQTGDKGTTGVVDTLPVEISTYGVIDQAVVGSATVKVYVDGILKETLTTGATSGTIQGTIEYSSGTDLTIVAYKANYAYTIFTWTVPLNDKLFDYWQVPTARLYNLGANTAIEEAVLTPTYAVVSGDQTVGASVNFKWTGIYRLGVVTDHKSTPIDYIDPNTDATNREHYSFATLKANQTDKISIDGWTLSNDGLTWYMMIPGNLFQDASEGLYGVFVVQFVARLSWGSTTHVSLTPGYYSDQDPDQMLSAGPISSGAGLSDVQLYETGTAIVFAA